jgi:diguanylate cyclase (GGDEF)-like protein
MTSSLANNISAINSMLLFKEYMGQIRAIGMNMVQGNNDDIYSNLDVSLLVGQQLHALRVFKSSANNQQIKACADFCHETKYIAMLKQLFFHTMNDHAMDEKSQYWFDSMSKKIDDLKVITGTLTLNLNNTVTAESQSLRLKYFAIFVALSVFLLVMILFSSILNFSIINPIRRITYALNNMSKGNLTVHLEPPTIDDEIGSIKTACEELRRKLLQVGIFKSVVDSQKKELAHTKSQQEHFKMLAYTDALTGAVNRHQFNSVLDEEILRANREHQDLSILMLDIDNFKKINDTFGHGIGDEVLVMFYNTCKKFARNDDVVARIGGEEFVIVLPKTNSQSAYQFADRLREQIQDIDIFVDDNTLKFTVSIGVSQWNEDVFSNAVDFVADADKLLYKAKNKGKNRVISA